MHKHCTVDRNLNRPNHYCECSEKTQPVQGNKPQDNLNMTDWLTYLLTPWNRVLLEKLTCFQLVKKVATFYGTWRFITTYTSAHHLSLSWASPIQSILPHPTSWRSILILSSHLHLGVPSGLFPSDFPTKTLYMPSPHPYALLAPSSHFSQFYHLKNIGWGVQIIQLLLIWQ